jgi:hypothetical protein
MGRIDIDVGYTIADLNVRACRRKKKEYKKRARQNV